MHPSVNAMCKAYFESKGQELRELDAWHFCDNETDANECAALTLEGTKRATTPSLAWFQKNNQPLPAKGDLNVVTDWSGEAQCIIQTCSVAVVPFSEISEEYARIEGEGDKSLEYWREVHWDYYIRELAEFGMSPAQDMPVVCEMFEVVFPTP